MKKMILSAVAFATLSFGSAYAQSENGLIGKARGAAHDCLTSFSGNDWEVWTSVGYGTGCPGTDTYVSLVNFSARPVVEPCNSLEGCNPPPLPIIVASIEFDCNGNIISNSCY